MEQGGLPAGPVLTIRQMQQDPQAMARDMVVDLEHPVAGPVQTLGLPVKFSSTPGGVRDPAPLLGQHTRAVLTEVGYDATQIDALLASGAAIQTED